MKNKLSDLSLIRIHSLLQVELCCLLLLLIPIVLFYRLPVELQSFI